MDEQLLECIEKELEAGRAVELCVLIATHGSSPRKAGACLAVCQDGSVEGTVGGGALERLVVKEAREALGASRSCVRSYTMDGEQSDTGMICGGDALVCLLNLLPGLTGLNALLHARRQGSRAVLIIDIEDPDDPAAAVVADDGGRTVASMRTTQEERHALERMCDDSSTCGAIMLPDAFDAAACGAAIACMEPTFDGRRFMLPIAAEGRVYIFGGGHVGAALVPVLAGLGFEVVVYDARPELAIASNYPAAERVVSAGYSHIDEQVQIASRDYVVVCTPAHSSDFEVVSKILPHHPRFLGCLGSTKKTAFIKGKLAEEGFSADEIDRLRMPVGIPLGDETPAEIAISIAAQIICVRRGHPEPVVSPAS